MTTSEIHTYRIREHSKIHFWMLTISYTFLTVSLVLIQIASWQTSTTMDKLIYYLIIVILIKIALSEVFNKIEINTKQKTIILNYTFSTKTIPINEIKKWGIRNRWQNKSFYTQSIEIRLKSGEIIGYPLSGLEFSQNTTKNENYFAKHIGIKPTKLKTYKFRLLPGTWSYFWL